MQGIDKPLKLNKFIVTPIYSRNREKVTLGKEKLEL